MSSRRGPAIPGSVAAAPRGCSRSRAPTAWSGWRRRHFAIGHLERLGLGDGLDQDHRALRQLAHGSDHFRVAAMADQQNGAPVPVVLLDAAVDLADQRAGGIGVDQLAAFRLGRHRLRHAVRREHHQRLIRHLVELLDEHRALGAQLVHHMTVVHDLVAHVDRRPVLGERLLDDLDGALDPGAEPARAGQQDVQLRAGHMAGHSPRQAWVRSGGFTMARDWRRGFSEPHPPRTALHIGDKLRTPILGQPAASRSRPGKASAADRVRPARSWELNRPGLRCRHRET